MDELPLGAVRSDDDGPILAWLQLDHRSGVAPAGWRVRLVLDIEAPYLALKFDAHEVEAAMRHDLDRARGQRGWIRCRHRLRLDSAAISRMHGDLDEPGVLHKDRAHEPPVKVALVELIASDV